MQIGQNFVIPAISGTTPKKNQLFPEYIPYPISAKPNTILNGIQNARILLKSIIYFLYLLKFEFIVYHGMVK